MRLRAGSRLVLLVLAACNASQAATPAPPGSPLAGLDTVELRAFAAGRALFDREFTPAEGLGPSFNQSRCSSCHDVPTIGGAGADVVTKVSLFQDGRCDLLRDHGGDLLQDRVIDAARNRGVTGERIPAGANGISVIAAGALFGLGRIESIPEAAILRHEDPEDRDGDGISGRAPRLADGRVGRFGRKSTFADLRSFVASALLGEMGLTSPVFPEENSLNGASLAEYDAVADPEIDDATLDQLTRFVQLLALPEPERPAARAARDSIRRGAREFDRLGCAGCHVRALAGVPLYSDLLLHDLGSDGAPVCAPGVLPSEWRTTPLAGLRHRLTYMHDGSAQSLERAIAAHGGEAARARMRFDAIPPEQQAMLLRFLRSL
ncbi:MAG TPA: di-heme oxidoredictase family protein [Longimicrobiales bacterium]|nr:di-heme oxidoredictase family protein [Longimicrobiales bacterium]